jgi:Flp pilus assembly protein protease CpaA
MFIADSLLLAAVLISAVTDLLERKIYNVVTLPLILIGIALHVIAPEAAWWEGFAGFAALGTPFFVLHAVSPGKMAAGDVKLLMAIGALGGIDCALVVGIGSIVIQGGLSAVTLLLNSRIGDVIRVFRPSELARPSIQLPFGLSIALATFGSLAVRALH